ncbi:MAG: VWA domain-containing protein [Candidatus Bathyarchaeota archaeon]|nr:VWA domain-containing protein [Candidatus Bathyarchaeota archaeon]
MGFLDYAWNISVQKDNTKVKILQDSALDQPTLEQDSYGFTVKLPAIRFREDGKISYLRETFPLNTTGRIKVGRLFRAAVLHLTTHTLVPLPEEKIAPKASDSFTEAFAKSLVRDVYVNACLQSLCPERFVDIAYANALAFHKLKRAERIFAPSTRVMSAILSKVNVGMVKGSLTRKEEQTVNALFNDLLQLKQPFSASLAGEQINVEEVFDEKVKNILRLLEPFGPFLEAPSLSYTEQLGRCSIFTETEKLNDAEVEHAFKTSIEALGGSVPPEAGMESCWRKEQDAEALQAFDSEQHDKERREKILAKITPYVSATRFKSVSFPEEDYSQYLRARRLVQGASRRLLDILRSAFNYLDENPRQEMGQLDLPAVIQSIASNKPATDVFTLEEYLKPSFAWSIIFDVSRSMGVKGEYGRALAIAVAEAAKELMTDSSSWTFFAFSNHFYILKDSNESYSKRVRARIGGLRFDGLTYIPDAIQVAGKMLAKRFEEQRCLIVISDGWPHGYPKIPAVLKESVDALLRKGVIVIGIGVETERMGDFFRLHSSIYTQKDLINRFGGLYVDASAKALET